MQRRKDSKGRVLNKGEIQREDGLYCYQYKSLNGKRKCVYNRDLNELRKQEKQIEKDLEDGINTENSSRSLNDQFEFFLSLKKDIALSTKNHYISMWNNNIRNERIASKRLCDIRKSDILMLYSKRLETNLSYPSLKELDSLLFRCFEMAVDDECIRKNPCKGCISGFFSETKKKEALTVDEQNDYLAFLKEDSKYSIHYPMVAFMIETAVRCGELTGLTWNDVDFSRRRLSVNHQMKYVKFPDGYRCVIDTPKTASGIRVIPLTEFTAHLLLKQKKMQLEMNKRTDVEIDGYKNFVFSSRNKKPFTASSINQILYNSVNAYNSIHERKMKHISAHTLRHTGCTRMAEAGVDIKVLQYLMGHSDVSVTMNVYNHISDERCLKEVKKLEKIIV